jgi:GDP-4-dehydro-6-deoxy-D-mannose reductase
MRTLVTGIDSFIGLHLARHLADAGDEVFGISRRTEGTHGRVTRFLGDIVDADFVTRCVVTAQPDRVFHLAAQSKIAYSFAHPHETMKVNVSGSLCVFEAVRTHAQRALVISVGSSSEYGRTCNGADLVAEDAVLEPTSPYAVSKVAQGMLGSVYHRVHGVALMHVRPFAVIGPGKTGDALGDFCQRVVDIEAGKSSTLSVGNLDAVRDFIDVRDCVAALSLVAQRGAAGAVYNICNARATPLSALPQVLRGLSSRPFDLVFDPQRLRPSDDPRIVGDNRKLVALGYRPGFTLHDTVRTTLDFWRERLGAAASGAPQGRSL